jgi:hypothetical protein
MAASIGTATAEKGAKLTPVSGEVPVPQPAEPAPGWNRADVDGILRSIDATEKSIGGLLNILRAEVRRGLPIEPDPNMVLDEGAAIEAARRVFGDDIAIVDRRDPDPVTFVEDFAAKSAAAQAATFKAPDEEPSGWTCSTHGAQSVTQLTSRKGREYAACLECEEFEK